MGTVPRLLLVAMLAVLLAASSQPGPAAANHPPDAAAVVRAWNVVTMTTLLTAGTPVPEQPLYLTYVHRAVDTAVRRLRGAPRDGSVSAAVTAAAHTVLTAHFPAQRRTLARQHALFLSAVPAGPARRAGIAVGEAAARAVLRDRADDGRNGQPSAAPSPGPGVWVPTPPNTIGASSWLDGVRPFVIESPSRFRPEGPPPLSGARWARDYNETRVLGSASSSARTAAQTEVARFWSVAPYVQNQQALRDYAERKALGVRRTAALFALADAASADALIACWDAKFQFAFWRPFSAVPAGGTDDNPATPRDRSWQPLLPTPNHPEYPSAHGCATTAIATVLAGLAPSGRLDLTMRSDTTGTTHHFSSVRQLTREMANARVWGGLHWRFATRDGMEIGRSVGRAVLAAR